MTFIAGRGHFSLPVAASTLIRELYKELNPMLRNLLNDESGFLVSAELVLIFTLVFCAVAVGVSVVRDSLVAELNDVAEAVGALDQSYNFRGLRADLEVSQNNGQHALCAGSGYNDEEDDCDCKGIVLTATTGKNDPSTLDNPEATNN